MVGDDNKTEVVPCEVCGHPVLHFEHGGYEYCRNCGWRRGCDNTKMEEWHGISYPMLVPLSRAKEQYKRGLPFKASFDEFVRGLLFYSEMLFDYSGETYEVFKQGKDYSGEPYTIVFCCAAFQYTYNSKEDFIDNASISGKLLKDIWSKVENPRFM